VKSRPPKENVMGKLTVTSFITLDNVVEDPHLWSGAFQSEDTGELNSEVLLDSDALLLGRVTYEGFAQAWPSRSGDPFSDTFNSMPKYVASGSLERADWNNSTIIADDVMARIRSLKEEQNLLVWGSPSLVGSLMDEGLVDEFVLLVSPIVRGKGIRLFRDGGDQHDLRITESTVLGGGMLALRMTPASAG
jgi:dihydrofolate reductase